MKRNYHRGTYYRVDAGVWERSTHPDGKWKRCPKHRLPPGLRKKMR